MKATYRIMRNGGTVYPREQWIIMDKMNSILSTKKKERKKRK